MVMESELLLYTDGTDLMGVITELHAAELSDEERIEVLQSWCGRVGRVYEEWMGKVVVGHPVGLEGVEIEEVEGGESE